jgi:ABC-type amino acid transport substrate-binding protein
MKILAFVILISANILAYGSPIKVGVLKFAPPFSSVTGNGTTHFGFVIDVMNSICKRMNEECVYKSTPLEKNKEWLDQGIIDVSFIPTPISSSQSQYLFSLPYFASNGQFISMHNSNINNLDDLKNHIKIGVVKTTLSEALTDSKYAVGNDIKVYDKVSDLFTALSTQEINVLFINARIAKYVTHNGALNFKLVGPKVDIGQGYGVMALKSNNMLIKKINTALLEIEADGTYIKIFNKYFGV